MKWLAVFCICYFSCGLQAQNETCSKLGAWLWHFEDTGFSNHADLADSLVSLGVKRVYVKVADGGMNTLTWPEIVDKTLVDMYKTRGMEVYAWSYNYPGNEENQALALYQAAITGYQGYVVDVESEFDGDSQSIDGIFSAFAQSKSDAIANGVITEHFDLYCTTWGNPMDHDFYISIIDPYVDGYLAQTYVEQWGPSFVENLETWIDIGNEEYKIMGATKPVHHIIAMQDGNVTAARATAFLAKAGHESSIWRIPAGTVTQDTWEVWEDIDWDIDFCETTQILEKEAFEVVIAPNPCTDYFTILSDDDSSTINFQLFNALGGLVMEGQVEQGEIIDATNVNYGIYFLKLTQREQQVFKTIVKAAL